MTTLILAAIDREIASAQAKHKHYVERNVSTLNYGAVLAVLVEEVGEVATALNNLAGARTISDVDDVRDNLRAELVQVAATAIRWIAAMDAPVRVPGKEGV